MKILVKILLGMFLVFLFLPSLSEATITIINGLTHEKEVNLGEVYSDFIIIKNTTNEVEEVKLYQTDFFFTYDGKKYYDKPGTIKRSNASWVTCSQSRLTIPPLNQAEVKYTVRVPVDNSLQGTYWSLIMVEGVPKLLADNVKKGKEKISFGIQQIMRSGIQIITHIGNTGTRDIKILHIELLKDKQSKILQVDVQNIGERWLRPYLFVDLVNEQGQYLGKFEGDKWRIFPGTSARFCADLSQVPDGKYKALVLIDNKDEYVFGAQYALDLSTAMPGPNKKIPDNKLNKKI